MAAGAFTAGRYAGVWLSVGAIKGCAGGGLLCAGAAAQVRDLPFEERAYGQASDGPRGGATLEYGAGKYLFGAGADPFRSGKVRGDRPGDQSGNTTDQRPGGYEVCQAYQDSEQATDGMVGQADVPWSSYPVTGGVGSASERQVSAGDLPWPF